jgi:hypothetical protein
MTLKFPDAAEEIVLRLILNSGESLQDLQLRLYVDDLTLAEDTVVGDFTEASFPGYSPVQLFGGNWIFTQGNPTETTYTTQEFVCFADTVLQTVYGYYVTRLLAGDLLWCERLDQPVPIQSVGNRVVITPRLELYDTSDV